MTSQVNLTGQTAGDVESRRPADRRVVITIDDLPGAVPGSDKAMGRLSDLKRWNGGVLHALHQHNVPAIGFVIENKLQVSGERDARAGILEHWIDAGLDLGDHTYSHVHFNDVSLEQFEDETLRGEVVTQALLNAKGRSERYFRHPALATGATPRMREAFESFLKSHKYRIAPVTVENADYAFNDVLDDALVRGDRKLAAKTAALYLAHTQAMFDYVEVASQQLFGREIPQILLIHDNELNSEMLDRLLTVLEQRGYRFVSLDDALNDSAYSSPANFPGNLGTCYLCWGSRLIDIGKASAYPPSTPAWIRAKFKEIREATGN